MKFTYVISSVHEYQADLHQAALRPLLTKRTVSYLNPKPELSQFQRSRSFMDGLEQATELWKGKFKVTARGMKKPRWTEEGLDEVCR